MHVFGFDHWHVSPLTERPYAQDIITYCNARSKRAVIVEIGCGLGDIIRNVDYQRRFGYDVDSRVLKAARFMTRRKRRQTEYATFSFPESTLEKRADVIILVNWIHHIEPSVLKEQLSEYFSNNLLTDGCLIIDTVGDREYTHNHNIDFLISGLKCELIKIGDYKRQREIWSIIKL